MLHEIEKIDNIGDIFVFMDVDFNNSGFKQNLTQDIAEPEQKKKKKKKKRKKEKGEEVVKPFSSRINTAIRHNNILCGKHHRKII